MCGIKQNSVVTAVRRKIRLFAANKI